jgi:hypothetical protein
MKIKHINSPKAGIVEHIRNDVGLTLVAAGLAEEVALPPRGSAGWLAARKEQSALATIPDAADTVVPSGTSWGLYQQLDKVVVVKIVNGNSFFYETPPSDCPADVRQRFTAPRNPAAAVAAAEEFDKATREQMARDAADKTGVFGTLFRKKAS